MKKKKDERQKLIIANKSSKSILGAVENFKFVEVGAGLKDEGQLSATEIISSPFSLFSIGKVNTFDY